MKRAAKVADDLFTVDEFYARVPDGIKADLIDGVIYMASPDTTRAGDLNAFMLVLIRAYNSARKLGGKTYMSRVAFRLTRRRAPEPDIGYVRKARLHLIRRIDVRGGPDVGVEIVSRDSRSRDYKLKKRIYEKAGVTEYWIIDPLKAKATFLRLKNGKYEPVPLDGGRIFRSKVISGFWLDVNWLFADPLPDDYETLQKILAK